MAKIKEIAIKNPTGGTYDNRDIGAEAQNIDVSYDSNGQIIEDIKASGVTVASTKTLPKALKDIKVDKSIKDLTDTNISASPSNGQGLIYNSSSGKWENKTIESGAQTLSGLTDTNISSPSAGQILTYQSGKWVNGASTTGDFMNKDGSNAGSSVNMSSTSSFKVGNGVIATGSYSQAFGTRAKAYGNYSHAEGYQTCAGGESSHVEGYGGSAGKYAHAEGNATCAAGQQSHAEGMLTCAIGNGAHTEGSSTCAGEYSHAEGYYSYAPYRYSHAEGYQTCASGDTSHTEGSQTCAIGSYSHAEGKNTKAYNFAHAEGYSTCAGQNAHAEGEQTYAIGTYSHSEGYITCASGQYSHAEGANTYALGNSSHAEGAGTCAVGQWSHAEGSGTCAGTDYSQASGQGSYVTSHPYNNSSYPGGLSRGVKSQVYGSWSMANGGWFYGNAQPNKVYSAQSLAWGEKNTVGRSTQHPQYSLYNICWGEENKIDGGDLTFKFGKFMNETTLFNDTGFSNFASSNYEPDELYHDDTSTPSYDSNPGAIKVGYHTEGGGISTYSGYHIYSKGMRFKARGIIDGVLVGSSRHKIYIPKGSVYWLVATSYLNTTGAYRGTNSYLISANGGGASTSALAVPKATQFGNTGTTGINLNLSADTAIPSKTGYTNSTYCGYVTIGSCTTQCKVEYAIIPILTPFGNFETDFA